MISGGLTDERTEPRRPTSMRIDDVRKLLFIPFLLLLSCESEEPSSPPPRSFQLTALDTLDNVAISGWIRYSVSGTKAEGDWELRSIRETSYTHLYSNKGLLEGYLDSTSITIDLNPGYVDNNLILAGTLEGTALRGTWHYSSVAGGLTLGTFEATP